MQQVHKRQGSTAAGCSTCGVSAWKARGRRVAQRAGSVSASLRNPASRRRVSARMPSGSLRCHSVSPASITTCVHTHVFAMWHAREWKCVGVRDQQCACVDVRAHQP